ncbi:hypothetical protein AURDEDRAFT_159301 [Auricularia subglabra TFB-10046 SS5]|nr:hypothetical protein AURDEDRAFT_159301 [Auricularia subglabra TFB-10046 SS5]
MSATRKLRVLSSFFARHGLFRRRNKGLPAQTANAVDYQGASVTSSRVDELEAGLRAVDEAPAAVGDAELPEAFVSSTKGSGRIIGDQEGEIVSRNRGEGQCTLSGEHDILAKNGTCCFHSNRIFGDAVVAVLGPGVVQVPAGEVPVPSGDCKLHASLDGDEMLVRPHVGVETLARDDGDENHVSRVIFKEIFPVGEREPGGERDEREGERGEHEGERDEREGERGEHEGEHDEPGGEREEPEGERDEPGGERDESPEGTADPRLAPTAAEVIVRALCDSVNYFAVEWVFVVALTSPSVQLAVRNFLATFIFGMLTGIIDASGYF